MLQWAIKRAGFDEHELVIKSPDLGKWLSGERKPTVKQLQKFAKKVYLPFGYLLLSEPPQEHLPIPFFRTQKKQAKKTTDLNVYDTILMLQQRQDWLREYLIENEFAALPFVGRFQNQEHIDESKVVDDIRQTLNLSQDWASEFSSWSEALAHLVNQIEDHRIIVVFNGVVGNNTHRKIAVEACRGFVLVDEMAPFMFINNADAKAAQMFTIVHELAHIWLGYSAGFDFRLMRPADDPLEKMCDGIAAEFLVPSKAFGIFWKKSQSIERAARHFKVSEIVIARRALDTGKINRRQFSDFYYTYIHKERNRKKSQGGNFYATTRKRLSPTFGAHIYHAVTSGQLLYRDAYKLTGLKGNTFQTFFSTYLGE